MDIALVVSGIIVLILLIIIYNSIFIVGGRVFKILERRWIGKHLPEGRVIAMKGEIGIQAAILSPGALFQISFSVHITNKTTYYNRQ